MKRSQKFNFFEKEGKSLQCNRKFELSYFFPKTRGSGGGDCGKVSVK
jgi:hypothetical protein